MCCGVLEGYIPCAIRHLNLQYKGSHKLIDNHLNRELLSYPQVIMQLILIFVLKLEKDSFPGTRNPLFDATSGFLAAVSRIQGHTEGSIRTSKRTRYVEILSQKE